LGPRSRGIGIALVRAPGVFGGDVLRGIHFYDEAARAARRIEPVEAVGWVATLPVVRGPVQTFEFDAARPGIRERIDAEVNVASAGYFNAIRQPLVAGRLFDSGDGALAPGVVIVNEVLARRYFGSSAVGRYLVDAEGQPFKIIGVVRAGKYRTMQEAVEPMAYFSLSQRTPEYMHLIVRTWTDGGPAIRAARDRLTAIDEALDVRQPTTLDEHLRNALKLDRVLTTVVAFCGLAALMLAIIGVYGIVDDAVRRRTPEIGLRVALGASSAWILRLVFAEGVLVAMAGSLSGVALTWVLARIVRVFVFGLPPVDVMSLAVAPLALVLVAIGAALLPTRRALRVSPTIALRAET
jgi:ABC-type antimicrobial peptide transport system permease subunit